MDDGEFENLERLIDLLTKKISSELADRLRGWPQNFANIQAHHVIGGLLARQATLTKEFCKSPYIWNPNSAPIILRSMADLYINLSWIIISPKERSLKFINYGLGQAKLHLEHRRAALVDGDESAGSKEALDAWENWISNQRLIFLQNVDLGNWSGISVRQMAIEAECTDFYNFVYSPFSACTHSMWNHIAIHDLQSCRNPLHRYHYVPVSLESDIDLHYLFLAIKYWNKTLLKFDLEMGLEFEVETSAHIFDSWLTAASEAPS
jgi:hypothetical protein